MIFDKYTWPSQPYPQLPMSFYIKLQLLQYTLLQISETPIYYHLKTLSLPELWGISGQLIMLREQDEWFLRWKTSAWIDAYSDRVKLNAFEKNYSFSKDNISLHKIRCSIEKSVEVVFVLENNIFMALKRGKLAMTMPKFIGILQHFPTII